MAGFVWKGKCTSTIANIEEYLVNNLRTDRKRQGGLYKNSPNCRRMGTIKGGPQLLNKDHNKPSAKLTDSGGFSRMNDRERSDVQYSTAFHPR
jgi:hypothetical protein